MKTDLREASVQGYERPETNGMNFIPVKTEDTIKQQTQKNTNFFIISPNIDSCNVLYF